MYSANAGFYAAHMCVSCYLWVLRSIDTHTIFSYFFFVLFSFGCKLLKCTDSVSVYLCYLVLFQLEQLNGQKANRLREFYPQLQASSTSWPTLYVLTRAFQHIRARIPVHCRVCSLWVLSPYVIDFAQKKNMVRIYCFRGVVLDTQYNLLHFYCKTHIHTLTLISLIPFIPKDL